jgi:hypothetical protein
MSGEKVWNDESRDTLRETLRWRILGELRLSRQGDSDILQYCCDLEIKDVCPEDEWETFEQFAVEELKRAAARLASEKATWPAVTDCDRLDRVEGALRERGILLWQVSPCCDTCSGGALPDRVDEIDARYPGFRDRVRGYAFFIEQTMAESLGEGTELSVYLAYGWWLPEDTEIADEDYKQKALGIAREVCEGLRNEGFEPNWDGDFARKIGISLNWQRRTRVQ